MKEHYLSEETVERWLWIAAALAIVFMVALWISSVNYLRIYYLTLAMLVILVAVGLQDRAWVLILLAWGMTGSTVLLGVPFSVRNQAILVAAVASGIYRIMTHRQEPLRWHPLFFYLGMNLLWLLTVFIRHPAGVWFLRSERVGGRPYIEIALAVVAIWVMLRTPAAAKTVARIPYYFLVGPLLVALLYLPAYLAPGFAAKLSFLYAALDVSAYFTAQAATPGAEYLRLNQLGPLGMMLPMVLCSLFPPRTLLSLVRWRGWFFLLGLVCLFMSGFRNYFAWVAVAFVLSAWLHRGWWEAVKVAVVGGVLLGMIIIGQGRLYSLPASVQRTMVFLPGKWSPGIAEGAKASTEWRFRMVREVLNYGLLPQMWLGQGFGMAQEDLWSWYQLGGRMGDWSEYAMVSGQYHNGPLSAIRVAGYVGLGMLLVLMMATAVYAVRCVRVCRGTILQSVAILLAIQSVWAPFHYVLLFGAYESDFPNVVLRAGLVVLVINTVSRLPRPQPQSSPVQSVDAPLRQFATLE